MAARDLLALMADYRRTASWAVWDVVRPVRPFTRDSRLTLPTADPALNSVLRSDVVLLGLNPGNAARDRSDGDPSHDYLNFHTGPKHNDHLIAEAFRDTIYWGAYMTDLYKQIQSKSALVNDQATDIDDVIRQISILNGGEPVQIIVFGGRAGAALARHSTRLKASGLVRSITQVPHYSGSNARQHKGSPAVYRELVQQAVHLALPPRPRGTQVQSQGKPAVAAKRDPRSIPLGVINDSANYDMVVRPSRPYRLSHGRVIDFTDRDKYPLATDHVRFAPIPEPKATLTNGTDSRPED